MINLKNLCHAYGDNPLLDQASWQLPDNQRWCLVGRNGAGKSTLFKIIAKRIKPDQGEVQYRGSSRVAIVAQDLADSDSQTVLEYLLASIEEAGDCLLAYQKALAVGDLEAMNVHQELIERNDWWHWWLGVEKVISQLDLPADQIVNVLSGGWRRRVAIAVALVHEPEVLLLDEPTNHLDISAIKWLEDFCLGFKGSILFISHDRAFIQSVAQGIVELDRGHLYPYQVTWDRFVEAREKRLLDEANQLAEFNKKLAQEETWIRQGIKARRTRNEGRVRRLEALRLEKQAVIKQEGKAVMASVVGQRSGKLVCELEQVSVGFGDKVLIKQFSALVQRGECVALVGDNGVGKTSLLNKIFKQGEQDGIRLGVNLDVAWLEQYRSLEDETISAAEFVGQGRDFIDFADKRTHVLSYLQDFLFSPERAQKPLSVLSGGERNRLMLARLFSKPANVLVLDEPTNDLDMDTLEVLEEKLADFEGTLFLVSHDRAFVEHLATQVWGFDGQGQVTEVIGGYQDWLRWKSMQSPAKSTQKVEQKSPAVKSKSKSSQKLSYKLQRELDALPLEIEALEAKLEALQAESQKGDFYQRPQDQVQKVLLEMSQVQENLDQVLERWIELTEMTEG